jgi:hypothetical protein
MKKVAFKIALTVLALSFVLMIPGMVRHTFEQGTGYAYRQQLQLLDASASSQLSPATREEMSAVARRNGVTYSAFALAGFHAPVSAMLVLFVSYCFGFTGRFSKSLIAAYVGGCLFIGLTCNALAQLRLGSNATQAVQGAVGIWILAGAAFGLLFMIVWIVTKLFGRSISGQELKQSIHRPGS